MISDTAKVNSNMKEISIGSALAKILCDTPFTGPAGENIVMTIPEYVNQFLPTFKADLQEYLDSVQITDFLELKSECFSTVIVDGDNEYDACVSIDANGYIEELYCRCPEDQNCIHIRALCLYVDNLLKSRGY